MADPGKSGNNRNFANTALVGNLHKIAAEIWLASQICGSGVVEFDFGLTGLLTEHYDNHYRMAMARAYTLGQVWYSA